MMLRTSILWTVVTSVALVSVALVGGACGEDELQGAQAEVSKTTIKLDLPQVPEFDIPTSDGEHRTPRELRLRGRRLFDTEQSVKGFVTWEYDCVKEQMAENDLKEKEAEKAIEEDPTICTKPHFFVGDTKDTPAEKSIWVVENPRPLREDEAKGLEKEDLKAHEELVEQSKFEVGDEVIVKGTWAIKSPKGFANSEGLMVFGELENLTTPVEGEEEEDE